MPNCSWGLCHSDSKYGPSSKRPREDMNNVRFIPFPKPKTKLEQCKKWIKACANVKLSVDNITKNHYVCSKHFVNSDGPTVEYPDPVPCNVSNTEMSHFLKNKKRKYPFDRRNQVPVVVPESGDQLSSSTLSPALPDPSNDADTSSQDNDKPVSSCPSTQHVLTKSDAETQTDLTLDHLRDFTDEELSDGGKLRRKLLKSQILKDDKSSKFYTGLSLMKLFFIFNILKEKASRMNYWKGEQRTADIGMPNKGPGRTLNLWEEFLITMIRLRRGLDVEHLSDMFDISPSTISRAFTSWLNLMYHELMFLVQWPSKDQVRKRLPAAFRYFKKTRCIIDCSELFIQRPSIPSSQRRTWSSYKHHNTAKFLVGVSPRGSFTFVSSLWTGNVSDRRIVEESGFLEKVERGDDIMADRGFLIRDLLALRGATLNIPPFSHGKQLAPSATTKTRRIARSRIHVERGIGRLKNFKIMDGTIPLKIKRHLNMIIRVCAGLCNLDKYLVK